MGYIKSAALEDKGFVVLDSYNQELDPKAVSYTHLRAHET